MFTTDNGQMDMLKSVRNLMLTKNIYTLCVANLFQKVCTPQPTMAVVKTYARW